MYRGNADKVMEDAEQIVKRLKSGSARITHLTKEYHCCYGALMKAVYSRITKAQWKRISKRIMAVGGIKNRFIKGHKPHNKNKKGTHFSPKTEFKKGHLPANHKYTGIISIRINQGIKSRWIKVSGMLQGKHKWVRYANYLWEKENGSIPEGYFVVHKDGDTLNDELSNYKLVDRAGHLKLQIERSPKMLRKCRKLAAKASKKRHARNRKIKEQLQKQKQKEIQRLVVSNRKNKTDRETLEKLRSPVKYWWECTGCGNNLGQKEPIVPCPKCNGLRSEKIKHRRAIAI